VERGWQASSDSGAAGAVGRSTIDGTDRSDGSGAHETQDVVLVQWTFTAGADAPGTARGLVQDALAEADADLDVILLMVSELVTNAVLHTRRNARLSLVDLGERGYRVEVEDHDTHLPEPAEQPGAGGGFGLRIIDNFARSWGTTLVGSDRSDEARGKVVWFEVDRRA
jgi:anti-sigma regulatory factor (Ser/Thr protein kinase)